MEDKKVKALIKKIDKLEKLDFTTGYLINHKYVEGIFINRKQLIELLKEC